MTIDEAKHALEELKKQGNDEETILKVLYLMYADGKMDLDDLRTLTGLLGYEFTDEFEAMSEEDKKTKGLSDVDEAAEGVDKEQVEDAKEYEPKKESNPIDDKKDADSEEDERKKAMKLFGLDK